ncbi:MAG: hypothetical protein O7H41_01420 [Planctomycetota bacterium]|nr:hypothetical protein [Planctomycetota bacterium]
MEAIQAEIPRLTPHLSSRWRRARTISARRIYALQVEYVNLERNALQVEYLNLERKWDLKRVRKALDARDRAVAEQEEPQRGDNSEWDQLRQSENEIFARRDQIDDELLRTLLDLRAHAQPRIGEVGERLLVIWAEGEAIREMREELWEIQMKRLMRRVQVKPLPPPRLHWIPYTDGKAYRQGQEPHTELPPEDQVDERLKEINEFVKEIDGEAKRAIQDLSTDADPTAQAAGKKMLALAAESDALSKRHDVISARRAEEQKRLWRDLADGEISLKELEARLKEIGPLWDVVILRSVLAGRSRTRGR